MNIVCDKTLLSSAIDGVSKAVTLRSSIPALEGILMKADGFQLTLTGYDLEMGITTTIEANVREPGEIVLSAKLLGDMVRRLPSGDITISTNESGNATVKGGVAEFDILAMSASDYPDLPNPSADHTLTIKASTLQDMIDKTLYAVSQDDKKPAHTGELFSIEPDKLTVVALDGYRLAIVERPIQADKSIRIIIPAKTLTEVNKLLHDPDEDVRISANRRFVVFNFGNYTILSRLIEGEFLNYANVIPNGCKTKVVLETRDFIETIERASLIITERLKNPLRIMFDNKVTVRCQTNLGKVVDEFQATIEGDSVEIGFNNRYLLDALRNSRCEKVIMEMSGPLSPVKILPAEGEDFTYLVLPVRFKND
jgi:DNA polymerase-3 subunit beta